MERQPVISSNLESVGYDEDTEILEVEFKKKEKEEEGILYHYFSVPAEVHQSLMSAPSVGKYFSANVKKYKCRKL